MTAAAYVRGYGAPRACTPPPLWEDKPWRGTQPRAMRADTSRRMSQIRRVRALNVGKLRFCDGKVCGTACLAVPFGSRLNHGRGPGGDERLALGTPQPNGVVHRGADE